jgi:uncharacterized protein
MVIKDEISKREIVFVNLCQDHNVKYIYAFGSSTNDRFNFTTSDIDLLLEIEVTDPVERGEKLMSLWDHLESFFKRKVDLLTESSLRNPYLKSSIENTKVLIYDGTRQEVFV